MELDVPTPRWAVPLHRNETPEGLPVRYRGAWGGRGSGKSHEFAGKVVEEMIADPDCSVVCIREIQKSLALSAKKLIEAKIEEYGVSHLFEVLRTEIRRIGGKGLCIFQGMQDHTADSVKSLEGFQIAWVEEAQSLSKRSLELLRPTIRAEGSEIWFSWNPRFSTDPVEKLLRKKARKDAIVVKANYTDNPWLPDTLLNEAISDRETNPDGFGHVWLGEYENLSSKVVIPPAWIRAAIGLADKLGIEATGPVISALDVAGADEGGDANAQAIRKGCFLLDVEVWNGLDTALTTQKAAKRAAEFGAEELYYDSVGVGEGVTGEWASMGRRDARPDHLEMIPWNGGASVVEPDEKVDPESEHSPLNKDQYENLKAQAYFGLRRRFENAYKAANNLPFDADNIIYLPAEADWLESIEEQLSQPQHKASKSGKTMVDKQPNGAASPNESDAIVMSFCPLPTTEYDISAWG